MSFRRLSVDCSDAPMLKVLWPGLADDGFSGEVSRLSLRALDPLVDLLQLPTRGQDLSSLPDYIETRLQG